MNDLPNPDTVVRKSGIGASVRRKEDLRHLHGRGRFVADIRMPGLQEVAFLRSPLAHARILRRAKPQGDEDDVLFLDDLTGVLPVVTRSALPGYKVSEYPVLAGERVRFVGEPIALCVAPTRAAAEDLTELVEIEDDELPPIVSCTAGRAPDATLLHEHWGDNLFLQTDFDSGIEAVIEPRRSRLNSRCPARGR